MECRIQDTHLHEDINHHTLSTVTHHTVSKSCSLDMYGVRPCAVANDAGLEVFCLEREIMFEPTNTLILHLTFGYHQAGIKRPILDSLETVWDRAVSLHSYAVSEAESSGARRFHWDNVPIPGGHTQTCLYGPVRGPVNLAAVCLLPTSVPFPAPSPFNVLPQRLGMCLCGLGGGGAL